MQKLKLALVQMQSKAADVEGNVAKAMNYVSEAAGRGADLVLVPEFFNTEYFYQYRDYGYLDYAEPQDGPTVAAARKTDGDSDAVVVAEIDRGQVYAARRRYPVLRDRRPEVYGPLTQSDEVARATAVTG